MQFQPSVDIDWLMWAGIAGAIVLVIIVIGVFKRACSIVTGCVMTVLVIGGIALLFYLLRQPL